MATLKEALADLQKRLMPEGMEWPRYEDGDPVLVGSMAEFGSDDSMTVMGVELTNGGFVLHGRNGGIERPCQAGYRYGERVKRPAVLAADGMPVAVGQTIYANGNRKGDGTAWKVVRINHGSPWCLACERADGRLGAARDLKPGWVTHRSTIRAADGKPLEAGQTVWDVNDGKELEVVSADCTDGMVILKLRTECGGFTYTATESEHLTHTKPEPPDSWERIEEDLSKSYTKYWGCANVMCNHCPAEIDGKKPHERLDGGPHNCVSAMRRDIMRRCKALAERGE